MGYPVYDILGKRIGCYTVTERIHLDETHTETQRQRSHWRVVCSCGFTKVVSGQNITRYFPLRCNHVPEGWRCIGPEDVALLEAARKEAAE